MVTGRMPVHDRDRIVTSSETTSETSSEITDLPRALPTWIVLIRDIADSIQIPDEPEVVAAMVLDADTGLVRGLSVAASGVEACEKAMVLALTQPAAELPALPPRRVVHGEAVADEVRAALGRARGEVAETGPDPELFVADAIPEAEDIFDSFVGRLLGRHQPIEPPTAEDWPQFYAVARDYLTAEPWQRWSDADHLRLHVMIDEDTVPYVAVVMGQAGIQRGLALYPGEDLPAGMADWAPGDAVAFPSGSVVIWLDGREDSPPEFVNKALRYGWPVEAREVPLPLAVDAEGPGDLDQDGLRLLTVGATAVLAHDQRRGRPVSSEQAARATGGSVTFADGQVVVYAIG